MKPMHRNRGFTLIEILIVMAIIGMLVALVGPALFSNFARGQRGAAQAQMELIGQGLDTYLLDVGRYPRTLEGLIENDTGREVWKGPYLRGGEAIPKDPWGNDYVYEPAGDDFELMSLGADGAEGGEGDDEDIEQ